MPAVNDRGDSFAGRQATDESTSLVLFQSITKADWDAQPEVRGDKEPKKTESGCLEVPDLPGTLKYLAAKIDLDKDGMLSGIEMVSAVEDKSITGKEAQALAALYRNKWSIAKLYDDHDSDMSGVSLNDIDALEKAIYVVSESQKSIARTFDSQRPEVSNLLFANSEDPIQSIRPDAIKQGMVGNCYFEAALASVAATDPASIVRMITDMGDGVYSVKFPGVDYPVMVSGPTETELGLFNGGGKDGIWACVLEKAFGAYKRCEEGGSNYSADAEGADGGGDPSFALKMLTGKESRNVYLGNEEVVRAVLAEALQDKRAITTHTPNWGPGIKTTLDGFPTRHAYSILNFDPNGPEGGTVTLRNPWAGRDDTPEGLMKISLRQLSYQFVRLSISGSGDQPSDL